MYFHQSSHHCFLVLLLLIGINCKAEYPSNEDEDPLLVSIDSGKVRGKVVENMVGNTFYAFQGIPYAKKPVGNLRFKPLEKVDPWTNTFDATKTAPDCLQDSKGYSTEDCIYLNVFTHLNNSLHPVMVYIFGGALTSGSCNPETTLGPEFLLTREIVLVTFNYRLGILGFLNYEYPESPGNDFMRHEITANNGFKDQVFALQWIQENIEHFGGDKNSVTIFGNSAGAVSSHALLISPLTENLFHRAIIQSGTAITRGLTIQNSAIYVGEVLGVNRDNATQLLEMLRGLNETEIKDVQEKIDLYRLTINQATPAGLMVEQQSSSSFMPENPWTLIQNGQYHRRPVMFGFLDAEGLIYYVYRFLKDTKRYFDINAFVPYYYKQREFAALEIDEDFFPQQNYDNIYTWIDIWGYSSFIFDIVRCAEEHMKWSNVWFYQFELDTELNWSKKRADEASKIKGACHGDELGYLFKRSTTPEILPASENAANIEKIVEIWTNFAINGMPSVNNLPWPPIRKSAFNILKIGANLTIQTLNTTKIEYWKKLYNVFSNKQL